MILQTSLFCTVGVLTTLCNAALFMLYIRQLRNDKVMQSVVRNIGHFIFKEGFCFQRDGQRHRPLPLLPIRTSTNSLTADYNEYEEPKSEQQ